MYFFTPLIAEAATGTPAIQTLVYRLSQYVLNPLIELGFVVALLYFLWGVVQYIRDKNSGSLWDSSMFDKDDKSKMTSRGGDHILYGLIGLFIMVSAYGILNLIKNVLGSNIPLK